MGCAEPEREVILGPRRAAPPRARAADGAAGLLSALGAPGVRGGVAGEPRLEPKPREERKLAPGPQADSGGAFAPPPPGRCLPTWGHDWGMRGAGMRSGSGSPPVLTARALRSRPGPARARAGREAGAAARSLEDEGSRAPAGGGREWARPSRRELILSGTAHPPRPASRPQKPGAGPLCAAVGRGLVSRGPGPGAGA